MFQTVQTRRFQAHRPAPARIREAPNCRCSSEPREQTGQHLELLRPILWEFPAIPATPTKRGIVPLLTLTLNSCLVSLPRSLHHLRLDHSQSFRSLWHRQPVRSSPSTEPTCSSALHRLLPPWTWRLCLPTMSLDRGTSCVSESGDR